MNRIVASRFSALSKGLRQPKRNHSDGHHEIVNPGPPCTFDYMTIPHQSYQQVHGELNSKFNVYMLAGFATFVASFSYALYEDVFSFESLRVPKFYRNRQ